MCNKYCLKQKIKHIIGISRFKAFDLSKALFRLNQKKEKSIDFSS